MHVEFRYIVCALCLVLSLERSFGFVKERRQLSTLYRKNLKQMVDMLDEDVDPCGDFFLHACGYYEQSISYASDQGIDDDSSTPVPPMLYNHEDRMHFFYEQHEYFTSNQVGKFLSQLYTECKQLKSSAAAKDPIKLWRHVVRQLPVLATDTEVYRAWPFLHYQWSELKASGFEPNWAKLVATLAAHGVETNFLHVFFAEHTIYLAPPDSVPYCGNFTQVRDSLRPLLSGRNVQIADVIGRELFLFCDELNMGEVKADADVQINNDDADLLKDDVLNNYFHEYFAHLNFTDSDVLEARKVLLDVPRIRALLRLFRKTNERIIYNYALWRTYEAFKLTLDDCFSLTDEFEELLLAAYWQWNVFEHYFQRDVALATYMFHTTRFQQLRKSVLIAANWAAFLEPGLEGNDFNLPRLITAYANDWLAPQLQTVYETLEWRQGAFFANLVQMRRLRLRAPFKQPHQDVDDHDHPHYYLRTFLYFSILITKEPLFHYFATQGFDLWHTSKLLSSTDGYYTALDCLEQQSRLNMDVVTSDPATSLFHMLSEEEVLRIFNFHRTFLATLRDYQFWLQGEFFAFAEDFVLEFFELDSQRIMFYAVAQQYCGRNDELFGGVINRSFMNVLEFEEAFNCTAEASMNPVVKCMINSCVEMDGVI